MSSCGRGHHDVSRREDPGDVGGEYGEPRRRRVTYVAFDPTRPEGLAAAAISFLSARA